MGLGLCVFQVFQIILKGSQSWEAVDWLAEVHSALWLVLIPPLVLKWGHCFEVGLKAQSVLLGEMNDASGLVVLGPKPGGLYSGRASSCVTSGSLKEGVDQLLSSGQECQEGRVGVPE